MQRALVDELHPAAVLAVAVAADLQKQFPPAVQAVPGRLRRRVRDGGRVRGLHAKAGTNSGRVAARHAATDRTRRRETRFGMSVGVGNPGRGDVRAGGPARRRGRGPGIAAGGGPAGFAGRDEHQNTLILHAADLRVQEPADACGPACAGRGDPGAVWAVATGVPACRRPWRQASPPVSRQHPRCGTRAGADRAVGARRSSRRSRRGAGQAGTPVATKYSPRNPHGRRPRGRHPVRQSKATPTGRTGGDACRHEALTSQNSRRRERRGRRPVAPGHRPPHGRQAVAGELLLPAPHQRPGQPGQRVRQFGVRPHVEPDHAAVRP